jgi:hypothetical protein
VPGARRVAEELNLINKKLVPNKLGRKYTYGELDLDGDPAARRRPRPPRPRRLEPDRTSPEEFAANKIASSGATSANSAASRSAFLFLTLTGEINQNLVKDRALQCYDSYLPLPDGYYIWHSSYRHDNCDEY